MGVPVTVHGGWSQGVTIVFVLNPNCQCKVMKFSETMFYNTNTNPKLLQKQFTTTTKHRKKCVTSVMLLKRNTPFGHQ